MCHIEPACQRESRVSQNEKDRVTMFVAAARKNKIKRGKSEKMGIFLILSYLTYMNCNFTNPSLHLHLHLGYQSCSDRALWVACYPFHHNLLCCSHSMGFCNIFFPYYPHILTYSISSIAFLLWSSLGAEIARTFCAGHLLDNKTVICDGPATILGWAGLTSILSCDG